MSKQFEQIKKKIYPLPELLPEINAWKSKGLSVGFTNGCFDLIHLGHIHYLAEASDLSDRLIIGVNSDASVYRLKGEGRPIQDERARAITLAAFSFIDAIVIFEDDTPDHLIQEISPNVLVKGGDYKPEEVVGSQHVWNNGGKVEVLSFLEGYSTSLIEGRVRGY